MDLIAARAWLQSLLEARLQDNAWDEVKALLDQYHRLPPKVTFVNRLGQLRDEAARKQQESKRAILTRTAQAQLADIESLIVRYLDDDLFRVYENALRQAQGGALVVPSPDWAPFAPQGAGFRVLMPGAPRAGAPLGGGPGEAPLRMFASAFQGCVYSVGFSDPPPGLAPDRDAAHRALVQQREQLMASSPEEKLLAQKGITPGGLPGLDLRTEVPPIAAGAEPQIKRVRSVLVPGGKAFLLSFHGPKSKVDTPEVETFFNSFQFQQPPAKGS